jgi:murein DD-endopeptidase MepM/ murein hydrolase activator NlpD
MADSSRTARRVLVRALALAMASLLVTVFASMAFATPSTKDKLDAAKAEFEQLKKEITAQKAVLARLESEAAVLQAKVDVAYGEWEQITNDLRNTEDDLHQAQDQYRSLQADLSARAREAYITGPGNQLEFVLGASSLSDLSARIEYVDALSQEDIDLATQVQNVKNALAAKRLDEIRLQEKAAKALEVVQVQQAAVDAKLGEAQTILDDLDAKEARMAELVKDLTKRYERELAALTGLGAPANGVFKYCPIGDPHAIYDGFGAPRYAGGYHPHAGNDIIAPQGTPIYATFDGYASASYNTLGGNSVSVQGSEGYTYNAHMMQPGYTGPVHAGDIIGYVGATGDTNTPHLHFEWHPNVTPTSWPASTYGYSVINTGSKPAVNPYPLLVQVCTV